jgi:hypothetical protein
MRNWKPSATRSIGLALMAITAVALAGCATLDAPRPGLPTTLLIGQLKLDVSGIGHAINGADGTINAYYPAGGIVTVENETSGRQYTFKTVTPANLFTAPFVEPGRYRVLSLWCQIETFNAWITLSSTFTKSPEFEVAEGTIANLGILLWSFRFDLWQSRNTAAFAQPEEGNAWVEKAFGRAYQGSPWLQYPISATPVSGDTELTSSVVPLQPRIPIRFLLLGL